MAKKTKKSDKPESGLTIKVTAQKAGKKAKKAKKAKIEANGFEKLVNLADHPLVADVLAAGALAAVAAFAESGLASKKNAKSASDGTSAKAVKTAGKAAAAAIGARLIAEFGQAMNDAKAKSQAK